MKPVFTFTAILVVAVFWGCSTKDENARQLEAAYPEVVAFSVKNPADLARKDAEVILSMAKIRASAADFNDQAFVILAGGSEVASQANDLDGDGNADEIVCVVDLAPNETTTFSLRYAKSGVLPRQYTKRTQAELSHKVGGKFVKREYLGGTFQNVEYLRVPPEHKDHSWYIRYEGPGWESDKIGYRFYLDWRNATDIFGKKIPDMVLQEVGQDGFDSYHEPGAWGMDILKVGESLGVGSVATWFAGQANRVAVTDSVTCAIITNGPVQSQIETKYYGWKIDGGSCDLVSALSIAAGSRLTKHTVSIRGDLENLCTGLVKLDSTIVLTSPAATTGWGYLATYGKQSLAGDSLGMVVFFRNSDFLKMAEDQYSHVVVLEPEDGQLTYYLGAAWEQEPDGIKNAKEFASYLQQTVAALNAPLEVE